MLRAAEYRFGPHAQRNISYRRALGGVEVTRLKTYVLQEQCKIDGVAPRPVTFDAFCLADAKRKAHSLSLLKGTTLVLSCADGTGATRERNKWSEIS